MLRHAALIATCVAVIILNAPLAGAYEPTRAAIAMRPVSGVVASMTATPQNRSPARAWAGWSTVSSLSPYSEAVPSPDGKVWICRRPDKTRRCVFGPPPNS